MNVHPPRRRLYVAGPMRNIPYFNYPRFHAVAYALRLDGAEVFDPAEEDILRTGQDCTNPTGDMNEAMQNHGFSLREALAEDTRYICKRATGIVLLPGWENSKGARAEHALAHALDLEFEYLHEDNCKLMELAYQRDHNTKERV